MEIMKEVPGKMNNIVGNPKIFQICAGFQKAQEKNNATGFPHAMLLLLLYLEHHLLLSLLRLQHRLLLLVLLRLQREPGLSAPRPNCCCARVLFI